MGREYRKDLAEYILYCAVFYTMKNRSSQLALKRKLKNLVPKFSSSLFYDHLKCLEDLGFLSIHPISRTKNLVKPELLTYLYALYRIDYAKRSSTVGRRDLWLSLSQRAEELLMRVRSYLIDHFVKHKVFLERLLSDDPETSIFLKALDRLITGKGKELSAVLSKKFLTELSKAVFEKYVRETDPARTMDFIAFIDIKEFEKTFLSNWLELYRQLAKSMIEIAGIKAGQDVASGAWCSSLRDALLDLPKGLEKIVLGAIKSMLHSLYIESLRAQPHLMVEYEEKLRKARRHEKVALILECPNCRNTSIPIENIFEVLKRLEVECEKCGCKVPLNFRVDENFLRWARDVYIPKTLMPALTRVVERMSTITCKVMAYRNRVICGAASTIEVVIEPPHPRCTFELTLIDPKGSEHTYNLATDDSSRCKWNYTFNMCGVWRIYASWLGDEDHIGALSREVNVLVI